MCISLVRILSIFVAAAKATVVITIVMGITILCMLAFGVAAKPSGSPVQPKICKPVVKAKAVGNTYAGLADKAINKWKSITRMRYVSSFADFKQADVLTVPIGFTNGKRWVLVKAKPCKSIGYGLKQKIQDVPKNFAYPNVR